MADNQRRLRRRRNDISATTEKQVKLKILPQPDETTCGPTCLHAVYNYYGERLDLKDVIAQTPKLEEGGTLASFLGRHALQRGFSATMYTYNLRVFDPTWFSDPEVDLIEKLEARLEYKRSATKLQRAMQAYIDFAKSGGELRFEDLTVDLIESYLNRSVPILTGLSSTYMYRCSREMPDGEYDDIRGDSQGHFVLLCGYDQRAGEVQVADPLQPNPLSKDLYYKIDIDRVIGAIMLGVLTYDANLLIIEPRKKRGR